MLKLSPGKLAAQRSPWLRTIALIVAIWVSLWASGTAGAWLGARVYTDFWAPDSPYSAEDLASLERLSPASAETAQSEQDLWEQSVTLARSVAGLEGALVGTVSILAVWISVAVGWLWARERRRRFVEELED